MRPGPCAHVCKAYLASATCSSVVNYITRVYAGDLSLQQRAINAAAKALTLAQVSAWMSQWLGPHSGHWSVIWTTMERPLGSGLHEPGLSPSCAQRSSASSDHRTKRTQHGQSKTRGAECSAHKELRMREATIAVPVKQTRASGQARGLTERAPWSKAAPVRSRRMPPRSTCRTCSGAQALAAQCRRY